LPLANQSTDQRFNSALGRADRPRSAAGMGSGFSVRSMMVPDPVAGFGLHTRSGTPSRREAKPDPVFRPRSSRDARPYLEARRQEAGMGSLGWERFSSQCPHARVLPSTQHSVIDPALDSALGPHRCWFRPSHEVRHAIASRGEARPRVSAADELGRSSLPKRHPLPSGQPVNRLTDQLLIHHPTKSPCFQGLGGELGASLTWRGP
jgi:hypothetical protein